MPVTHDKHEHITHTVTHHPHEITQEHTRNMKPRRNNLSLFREGVNKTPINTGSLETARLARGPPKRALRKPNMKQFHDNVGSNYHIGRFEKASPEHFT